MQTTTPDIYIVHYGYHPTHPAADMDFCFEVKAVSMGDAQQQASAWATGQGGVHQLWVRGPEMMGRCPVSRAVEVEITPNGLRGWRWTDGPAK